MMKLQLIILLLCALALGGRAQVISGKSGTKKITLSTSKTSFVKELPDLVITGEQFTDANGNSAIDANEKSQIRLNVENIGKGTAQKVIVRVSIKNQPVKGLSVGGDIQLGDIPGETKKPVTLPVSSTVALQDGMAEFLVEVREDMGFDAYPLEMKVETRAFAAPKVIVADAAFSTEDGGLIKLNYPIQLKVIVQNIGRGDASGVYADFTFPNLNCVVLGETSRFSIGPLARGESRELDFLFTATRRYESKEIPVNIDLGEDFNKYARDTVLAVGLQQELIARSQVVIAGVATPDEAVQVRSLSSDVDKNVPANPKAFAHRYALVIGNEDYSRYQRNLTTEANVPFARNDARVFADYAVKTLGVPADNLYLLLDATAGEMQQKIDLVAKLAAKTGPEAQVIVFYAGHGLPDEATKDPYLIPVDVSGTNLTAAVKLKDVYERLGQAGAGRITVFLDACFSGGGREAPLLAARAVRVIPKQEYLAGNMVVFSASSGEQMALSYDSQQHGLFTYYLLKKIQETEGKVSYAELADFLSQKISIESLKVNQKDQDPQVQAGATVETAWKTWKLYE